LHNLNTSNTVWSVTKYTALVQQPLDIKHFQKSNDFVENYDIKID